MSCVPARALFHTAPRCVEIREVPTPRPAAGEVLVRTVCSGISGGTERLVYRGEVPAELALDDTIDALGGAFSYPFAENDRYWLPIGLSDPDGKVGGAQKSLDTAMKIAVRNALAFLTEERGLAGPVAYAYLSAATDFTVSQVVDITTGVHGRIKKTDFGM